MTTMIDESETTADDDLVACDACESEVHYDLIDDDGLCPACAAEDARHAYTCDECGYQIDDREEPRHGTQADCCESCGETRVLNDAKADFEEMVGTILESDDLEAIRRAIRALKRIR